MRKYFSIIFCLLLIFASFIKVSEVRAFDFTTAFSDYQFALQTYDNSLSDYQDSRDFYLTNKTLTLKEDARKKTLKFLKDRDTLESVYLTALRIKILETKGISDGDKNTAYGLIDTEVSWYKEHINSYKDGDPLEDLFNKSKESESRYKTNTLPVIYQSLFAISLGETVGIRNDNEELYSSLKSSVAAGVSSGKLDMNPFNRWFSDIDSVINSLKTNEDKAKEQINKIATQSYSPVSFYNNAVEILSESKSSLGELNNFLTEVATSIQNQQ